MEPQGNEKKRGSFAKIIIFAIILAGLILLLGTIWMGYTARRETDQAVRSVSLFYLDELAGRREQVVESNLSTNISHIYAALEQMQPEDLSDMAQLQRYQARMKQLYDLLKFAFVDSKGLIYTSLGPQTNIDEYRFDYRSLSGPEVSVLHVEHADKKVVIAVPIEPIPFEGETLVVCFMEIDMTRMLQGVSMQTSPTESTFCNLYTADGIPLSNLVLGGLASEDNLLDALTHAEMEAGATAQRVAEDFAAGRRGVVSFRYQGVREALSYVPVAGTGWLLTYLIPEAIISEQVSAVSTGTVVRSVVQSLVTAAILLAMCWIVISQTRKNARLLLEKETSEAENRVRQEALEQRLALQEQLLAQQQLQTRQGRMITALAADYRSVYYVNLDTDECICYRPDRRLNPDMRPGDRFRFHETLADYGRDYVAESYREGFLRFIEPETMRAELRDHMVLVYRYLVQRDGREYYEMLRIAGVRDQDGQADSDIHALGVSFTDIDAEMRDTLARSQALSDALQVAENASRAKTAFLSTMSHEIRTPMNAIIGLDSIALNDPDISDKTRDYLQKIGFSAQHLLSIINDILDMSRIESGRMTLRSEEFSFSRVLEQVNTIIGGQCRDKGLQYECHLLGQVDDYYIGDDAKLRQVMINILGNAVKFTPVGGAVTFSVEEIARYQDKATLRLVMQDNGIGMSPEFLPKIFDTFSQEDSSTTNRYGSTGLGLAITKNLVEMMNGRIDVESEKGVGSTFTVTLTLLTCARQTENSACSIAPRDMSVLIVDDDPIALEHAMLALGQLGVSCEAATSGREAVEMVRLHAARRAPYNLILMDWKMPEMDGLETTRQIRNIVGHDSAIIILTAYHWDDIAQEAKVAGVDSFAPKPLFASTVLDGFREACNRRVAMAAAANKAELKGRRILVAEDMPVNAEIMMMVLEMREMEAELAENGQIAVDRFASHPAGYYDAILMDMRMPVMDGLEATRSIRALDRPDAKTIPIIALTANAFDEDVQRSLQAGLNAHLSKPVEPEQLYETLEGLIPVD